jgi:molecular chaperone DnaJ
MKDYYKILGLEKGASKDEVKKAFRKLAAIHHPDKKTGDEAKFKEISEAYAVLSDDKKKAEYDTYGHAYQNAGGNQPGGGFGGFNWQDFAQAQGQSGSFEFDLGDIFEQFGFGGGRQQQARGRDISIDIELSFKDAIFGMTRKILLTKNNICVTCEGTGAKKGTEMTECKTCNGNGKVREVRQSVMGSFQTVKECSVCRGIGKIPKERCGDCAGTGIKRGEDEIEINIPAGIQNGEMIRMTGRGEAIPHGQTGDLYVKIHVKPHPTIKREGSTLISPLHLKLSDALLGSTYHVETLDGSVDIKIPAGVKHGEMLRIKGKGVPLDSRRGDFMVKVSIDMPQKLSRKAKQLIEELQKEGI